MIEATQLVAFEQQVARIAAIECRKHALPDEDADPIAPALRLGGAYRTMLFTKLKQLDVLREMTDAVVGRLRRGGLVERLGLELLCVHSTLKGDLPGDDRFFFLWHQDYLLTRSHRAYRLWLPLRPVNAIDGGMEFAIGSHREQFPYADGAGNYPHIPAAAVDGRFATKVMDLPAGDGVLFDPRIVHRSVANHGRRTRFVLIVHLEDAAALAHPLDPTDPLAQFMMIAPEAT
jgi:hypothetical protein